MFERIVVDGPSATTQLVDTLASRGFALLADVTNAGTLLAIASSIGVVIPHRDSGPDGVTVLANRRSALPPSGFAGFTTSELVPHTDRSSVEHPPRLLLIACGQAAETGGECILVDGAAVYADLAETEPDAVRALSEPRSALFGGAAGYLGSVFAAQPGNRISVRLRLDELAKYSAEPERWLGALRAAIDRHVISLALVRGDAYVLDNHRWLHGRQAFSGDRIFYRVTADPLSHLGIPSGFLPPRLFQASA
jgi:alpha-ketoglutarate-dependent taurine dioxygenase